MKKVAIFGNTGAGKSTTSRKLSQLTGLPLYVLDKIQFQSGGFEISHDQYLTSHNQILTEENWIIDGFGCIDSLWKRLEETDTLVYIDLPIALHFWWVTKRFCKGFFSPPEGWPKNSPLWKSTLKSYQVLWLCHKKLTPTYRRYVASQSTNKTVYHLRSKNEIDEFLNSLKDQVVIE